MELIKEIYQLSRGFPDDERFCLTVQLRKSAISVAANIAEGSGRFTSRDLLNFLSQSRGSVKETESHVLVAQLLEFVTETQAAPAMRLTDEISRMLFGLRTSIRSKKRRRAGR
jgi:four helix bundle protein